MIEYWAPLAVQEGTGPGALRDAVPDVLEEPLRQWIPRVADRVDFRRKSALANAVTGDRPRQQRQASYGS